jgi:hypothetical protein
MAQIIIDGSNLIHEELIVVSNDNQRNFVPISQPTKTDWFDNGVNTFDLPNGSYTIIVQSANFSAVVFTVSGGIINYDTDLDAIVSGRETNTLVLIGVFLTIDARYLIGQGVMLGNVWKDFRALVTGFFLPNHPLHTYSFIVASSVVADINFRIDISGKIFFNEKYNKCASGNDSDTLNLFGYPVLIDGRNSSIFADANPIFSMVDNHNPSSVTNVVLGNYLPLREDICDGFYLLKMVNDKQKGFHINNEGIITLHSSIFNQDVFNGIRRVTII